MTATVRLGALSLFASAGVVAATACATEGITEPEEPSSADAAGDVATNSDAPTELDAGLDAGPCNPSGLCTVQVGIDTRINVVSIAGSSANDVWAVGSKRTVLHYDGERWEKTAITDDASSPYTMRSVWIGSANDVWIADGPKIRYATGWSGAIAWSSISGQFAFSAISGRDGTVAIATQQGRVPMKICSGWGDGGLIDVESPISGLWDPHYVAVSSADEIWATFVHPSVPSNRVLRAHRTAADGGDAGRAWQFEQHDSRFGKDLHGIWADADAVWLVGEGGALRRMTRDRVPSRVFDVVPSPVTADLRGVFGFGPSDLWAVGDDATVVHWDGSNATRIATPFDTAKEKPSLFAVWGSSPDDVWIGGNGVMLHYEGKAKAP